MKNTLKKISMPSEDANDIMSKLSAGAEKLPSISKKGETKEQEKKIISPRLTKSVSLPDYVWDQIRNEAFCKKIPMNVYIMHALKMFGLTIEDADLVDARTIR